VLPSLFEEQIRREGKLDPDALPPNSFDNSAGPEWARCLLLNPAQHGSCRVRRPFLAHRAAQGRRVVGSAHVENEPRRNLSGKYLFEALVDVLQAACLRDHPGATLGVQGEALCQVLTGADQ
jgi:hypothetical protein